MSGFIEDIGELRGISEIKNRRKTKERKAQRAIDRRKEDAQKVEAAREETRKQESLAASIEENQGVLEQAKRGRRKLI